MSGRHPNANANQRARRARRPRIDYYPAPDTLAAIEARRTRYAPGNSYTGILDAIVREWAAIKGIALPAMDASAGAAGRGCDTNRSARARFTPTAMHTTAVTSPELPATSRAHAPARLTSALQYRPKPLRVICGARRRRDGRPCEALSVPGKRRCKWHGGCSTGPRSDQGRRKALENLRQFRVKADGKATNPSGRPACQVSE